jgi:hypothetical protein
VRDEIKELERELEASLLEVRTEAEGVEEEERKAYVLTKEILMLERELKDRHADFVRLTTEKESTSPSAQPKIENLNDH